MYRALAISIAIILFPLAGMANGWSLAGDGQNFQRVTDKDSFVELIEKGTLRRVGISLEVEPDGAIGGRAFGRKVSGKWDWKSGYFCRVLFWGSREMGNNCQSVAVSGNLVRFTSDQGKGDFADLRIE